MTKKRAREVSLLVWSYLAEFPRIDKKKKLPRQLYALVKDLFFECPLCEVFFKDKRRGRRCVGCPLEDNCVDGRRIYLRWADAASSEARGAAARVLLDAVIAWSPRAISKKSGSRRA